MEVVNYRLYMDYVEEMTQMYRNVPEPPLHIKHNPIQFFKWAEWASEYKNEPGTTGKIEPFGNDFSLEDDVDDFIAYYNSLRNCNTQ